MSWYDVEQVDYGIKSYFFGGRNATSAHTHIHNIMERNEIKRSRMKKFDNKIEEEEEKVPLPLKQ